MVLLVIILLIGVIFGTVAAFAQLSTKDCVADVTELKTLTAFLLVMTISNFAMILYLVDQLPQ